MRDVENYKQNACLCTLASFTLDNIIVNTNFESSQFGPIVSGKLLLLKLTSDPSLNRQKIGLKNQNKGVEYFLVHPSCSANWRAKLLHQVK